MQTGDTTRTYTTNVLKFIVEGYSKRSNCFVYPHCGWSWTSWQSYITDTYETKEKAVSAISSGYLKSMIREQEIVDIRIYAVTTVTECHEKKNIVSYDMSGTAIDHIEPAYATDMGDLSVGDYLIVENGRAYVVVRSYRQDKLYLDVINGGYTLILDTTVTPPVIHPDTYNITPGTPVQINHIGIPDPTERRSDYNHQIEFYLKNFDQTKLTSTKMEVSYEENTEFEYEADEIPF